jgi:hypothetical protein
MIKRTYGNEYGLQPRAVHTGNDVDSETGAIKRPITMANSYELPYDPTDVNWSMRRETYIPETAAQIRNICRKSWHP